MDVDLLKLVDQGGCSSKLPAAGLAEALSGLPRPEDDNILVGTETHDDAGVYRLRDDYALILTTDFFPPVCSDPYDYGQIAAANALSDVYAMGGQVLSALNIVLFPASLPLTILQDILRGGQDKVAEAGGSILGGHTIEDEIPKYGLSVTGWVYPDQVATNNRAEAGDLLILTKALGTGIIISARKNGLAPPEAYAAAIRSMKQLNEAGARIMNRYGIRAATDITGFGLLGHALKMATGSRVSMQIDALAIPALPRALELIETGCIPGAAFRNQEFTSGSVRFEPGVDYDRKMLLLDAQTSGGLFLSVKPSLAGQVLSDLRQAGFPDAALIGEVTQPSANAIIVH